jgi:hypothetical protein
MPRKLKKRYIRRIIATPLPANGRNKLLLFVNKIGSIYQNLKILPNLALCCIELLFLWDQSSNDLSVERSPCG